MKLKKGDVVIFGKKDSGMLKGAEGYIMRISKRTQGLTVKLTKAPDGAEVYKAGTEVQVPQYEVTPKIVTRT